MAITRARWPSARSSARHANGAWTLVFQRPFATEQAGCVRFQPGVPSEIAFAIWDGSNRDRSAQKAVSAGLLAFDVEV